MILSEEVKKILELAVNAPSGDNSQPWRFRVKKNCIEIFTIRGRNASLYDFRGHGSLVAHGALLENILIASRARGFIPSFSLFPEKTNTELIASVTLTESSPTSEFLYDFISSRTTNRKRYDAARLLTEKERASIMKSSSIDDSPTQVSILLREKIEEKEALAQALSANERLFLENFAIHKSLFTQINWTEGENQEKKRGMYVKTLELAPSQEKVFSMLRSWPLTRVLNMAGLSRFIAKDAQGLYKASSAIGAIIIENDAKENFISTGRVLERIWLNTTKMGLSLQPLGGLVYLAHRVHAGDTAYFSARHTDLIKKEYENIQKIFGMERGLISMLFRVGKAQVPVARSLKLSPDIATE